MHRLLISKGRVRLHDTLPGRICVGPARVQATRIDLIAEPQPVFALLGKAAYIFALIGPPMLAGYAVRRHVQRSSTPSGDACRLWSRRIKLFCIGILVPPIAVTAMIRQPLAGGTVLAMGMLGAACILVGAVLGRLYLVVRPMPGRQAGAFFGCAAMSNVVSIGGLVVFAFWENDGLQQVYLFKMLEHVLYFGVFYPWCGTFNPAVKQAGQGIIASFRNQPITLIPIAAVVAGLVCNFVMYRSGADTVGPPAWTQSFNHILVPWHVLLLSFAVGLSISPSRIGQYVRPCIAILAIGAVARPLAAAAIAYACLQAGWISDLGFRVAVVLSAMPVAFNALIPPSLYDLDEDLANSCWMVSTAMMLVTVPVLFVLLV